MTWWDVFVILFIAWALWRGYVKGLALRLGGWVGASVVFVLLWYGIDALDAWISPYVKGRELMAKWLVTYMEGRNGNDVVDTTGLEDMVHALPLPTELEGRLMGQLEATKAAAGDAIYGKIADILAVPLWHMVLFLLAWACGMLILWSLGRLWKRALSHWPIVESLDRFIGALVSAVIALPVLAVLGFIATVFVPGSVGSAISESFFGSFLKTLLITILQGSASFLN